MWYRRNERDPAAAMALREAERHLAEAKTRDAEVHKLAKASKKFRRKNHFAEDLQRLFEGGSW